MAKKISKKDLQKKLKGLSTKLDQRGTLNKDLQQSVERLEERLKHVERRLDQVESSQARTGAKESGQAKQPSAVSSKTTSASQKNAESGNTKSAPASPDESWTVKQLRDEARKREVPSYSTKNKAELLNALG
jgi:TolA-binding protein